MYSFRYHFGPIIDLHLGVDPRVDP